MPGFQFFFDNFNQSKPIKPGKDVFPAGAKHTRGDVAGHQKRYDVGAISIRPLENNMALDGRPGARLKYRRKENPFSPGRHGKPQSDLREGR
jgi:hypothetical protein